MPKALGYAGITVTLEDIGNELGEDVHPSSAISLAQFETLASKVCTPSSSTALRHYINNHAFLQLSISMQARC